MPQRSTLKLNTGDLDARLEKGAVKGLGIALEHLLQASREEVPHEEGTLERSGTTSVDASALEGAVSYDTPYAVIQHEALDFKHDAGRKAKYLEDPFDAEAGTMNELIAAQVRRSLR
ncbi:hypothetical protein FXF51_56775 [Nonomuraea sp. PA05]|uniref:hypothetical protein n=1 Tax=Nonomuraea sp. PA05 TaxID=2604466 RepID=UPI0011DA5B0F|nr:hypothetical protein [Nonomuraea sp. PA05]TYB50237.1 hypothetical protein FXF51_56775 [Nonomuraea sp. PA05]